MNYKKYESVEALEDAAVDLLVEHFTLDVAGPHAVMLTGGNTPTGIYRRLARTEIHADDNLHMLESDERHVPCESEENNYAKMRPLIERLGVAGRRIMRVHTELELHVAADRYDRELSAFFAAGGRITLGVLGLGADGHVASLFTPLDIARGNGRWAIAVARNEGPDRVSVSGELLRRVERLVFLVSGKQKETIVRDFLDRRQHVVALQVIEGCGNVELWQSQFA